MTASDADGAVKTWSVPKSPSPPSVEGDVATDLTAYENASVEVESAIPAGTEPVVEDWFVIEPATDLPEHH